MFSIKGIYENGKIKLLEQINLSEDSNIIITFLDHDIPFSTDATNAPESKVSQSDFSEESEIEEHPEEYYEQLREHKRYQATGKITVVKGSKEETFPLNDYSSGGLSFFSDRAFTVSSEITAALRYSAGEEELVMDFNMEVRGVFENDDGGFKIGCQFDDQVDEQLWHTVMS
jgi:predicted DNA-binding antitoxin AbrB/MazE fold protein